MKGNHSYSIGTIALISIAAIKIIVDGNDNLTTVTSRRLAGGEPLFGRILDLNSPLIFICSVVITIIIVQLVEKTFEGFHSLTHETPFNKMVVAIEKELMAVGFTALLFKVACNSAKFLTPDWYLALEISDILVPCYVFCSCLLCMVMVLTAMKQCFMWSRAYHLKLEEVLDEFYQLNIPRYLEWTLSFYETVKLLEFRIYNIIFCEMHHISRAAPFNEYVSVCFEKYILSFIETYPSDWLILVLTVLLLQSISTWTNNGEWFLTCAMDDDNCVAVREVKIFTIFGVFVFAATIFLTLVTRHYQKAIMKRRGLDGISDYTEFLKQMDDEEVRLSKKNILTDEQLKATLVYAKEKKIIEEQNFHSTFYYIRVYPRMLYNHFLLAVFGPRREEEIEKEDATESDSGRHQSTNHAPTSVSVHTYSVSTKPTVNWSETSTKSSGTSSRIRSNLVSKKLRIISEDTIMEENSNNLTPALHNNAMAKDMVTVFSSENDNQMQEKMDDIESSSKILGDSSSVLEDAEENEHVVAQKHRNMSMGKKDADDVVHAIEGMMSDLNVQNEHGWNIGIYSHRDTHRSSRTHSTRTHNTSSSARSRLPSVSSQAVHPAPLVSSKSSSEKSFHKAVLTTVKSFILMRPDINPEISADILNSKMHIHKEKDFISGLFLFQKPDLYFSSLKIMLMIISSYFAFWIVQFLAASPGIWKVVSLLPGLMSGFLFLYVVKSAAILKAVYELDNEAMLEVLEQGEGSEKMGDEVREKLLSRLDVGSGDPFNKLKRLFNEIDDDGSHRLSRIEFEDLMRELGVHFSRKKWDHVFHEIDKNCDGLITFDEFFMFLYPHLDAAKRLEEHRLATVRRRVTIRSTQLEEEMKRNHKSAKAFSSSLV